MDTEEKKQLLWASRRKGGLHFEHLAVGDVLVGDYLVWGFKILLTCISTGDWNPIHWNPFFARKYGRRGIFAHGVYTPASFRGWQASSLPAAHSSAR